MKHLVALLLSFSGIIGVSNTSVSVSFTDKTPKEPPSTTLVVHGESTISVETKTTPTVAKQSVTLRKGSQTKYNISYDPTKRCPQFESAFKRHGLSPIDVFSYIAWRESRCDVKALNTKRNKDRTYDSGLLQINSTWTTVTANACQSKWGNMKVLLTLDCNLKVAKVLLGGSDAGLANWNIYKRS